MFPEAARCVKCGLCLAECPTYRLSANETLSPRGRIALIQALEQGQLEADNHAYAALNGCLLCRRCESMCPSAVPFARVMDRGRELVHSRQGLKEKLLISVLTRPFWAKLLSRAGRRIFACSMRLGRIVSEIQHESPKLEMVYSPQVEEPAGRVGLFVGCTGDLFDRAALDGAITLLLQAGFEVQIPPEQVCCGALDAHAGNAEQAARLMAINEQAFSASGNLDAVLSIASGCGAQLAGYAGMGQNHADICSFLAQEKALSRLRFKPLPQRVAVHIPCSLENVLHGGDAVLQLLRRIPQLQPERVGGDSVCCGAGGTAFLLQTDMADRLREPFLRQIEASALVLSGNVSCRLHLQAGLGADGPPFMHPLALLAQQLIKD